MQHMHGNIPHIFDSWADPVVQLLQLKSSRVNHNTLALETLNVTHESTNGVSWRLDSILGY